MYANKGSYTVNRRNGKEDADSHESSQRLAPTPTGHPERPDSSATDDQNVNHTDNHETSDVSSSGTESLDHHVGDAGDDNDASSEFIQKKIGKGSDSSFDDAMSSLTKGELMIRRAYLSLRLVLGTFNFTCFILKVPLLLLMLRIGLELSQQKKRESMVTTIEPPYDEEIVPASSPNQASAKSK